MNARVRKDSKLQVAKATINDNLNTDGIKFKFVGSKEGLPLGSLPREEIYTEMETKVQKGK